MKKVRTWPYAVVEHPGTQPGTGDWNVRKLDGKCLLASPIEKPFAILIRDALNEAFDWGLATR